MIRTANIKDLDIITHYNYQLAFETEGLTLDKTKLKNGVESLLLDETKGKYYLFEQENKVIGQLLITYEWSDWRNANFWWIQSVYVHLDYRKQGIFKALYKYIQNITVNDSSVCGLRLYVEKNNKKAQTTYRSLGMNPSIYNLYEWLSL